MSVYMLSVVFHVLLVDLGVVLSPCGGLLNGAV